MAGDPEQHPLLAALARSADGLLVRRSVGPLLFLSACVNGTTEFWFAPDSDFALSLLASPAPGGGWKVENQLFRVEAGRIEPGGARAMSGSGLLLIAFSESQLRAPSPFVDTSRALEARVIAPAEECQDALRDRTNGVVSFEAPRDGAVFRVDTGERLGSLADVEGLGFRLELPLSEAPCAARRGTLRSFRSPAVFPDGATLFGRTIDPEERVSYDHSVFGAVARVPDGRVLALTERNLFVFSKSTPYRDDGLSRVAVGWSVGDGVVTKGRGIALDLRDPAKIQVVIALVAEDLDREPKGGAIATVALGLEGFLEPIVRRWVGDGPGDGLQAVAVAPDGATMAVGRHAKVMTSTSPLGPYEQLIGDGSGLADIVATGDSRRAFAIGGSGGFLFGSREVGLEVIPVNQFGLEAVAAVDTPDGVELWGLTFNGALARVAPGGSSMSISSPDFIRAAAECGLPETPCGQVTIPQSSGDMAAVAVGEDRLVAVASNRCNSLLVAYPSDGCGVVFDVEGGISREHDVASLAVDAQGGWVTISGNGGRITQWNVDDPRP